MTDLISTTIHYLLIGLFGLALGWGGAMIWRGNQELAAMPDDADDTPLPDGREVFNYLKLTPREVLAIEVCLDRLDALGMPGYAAKARESARSACEKLKGAFLPKEKA